jgi:hypothetical protein
MNGIHLSILPTSTKVMVCLAGDMVLIDGLGTINLNEIRKLRAWLERAEQLLLEEQRRAALRPPSAYTTPP